ncbi:TPA: hypothetical protein JLI75_000001, partial [Escherichia coli]|nr:hypothetical protein [Escherichia coli]HBD1724896.1 deubiquitinase [Escherichia coli]
MQLKGAHDGYSCQQLLSIISNATQSDICRKIYCDRGITAVFKKTALSGDEESIELLHNIALGYDKFGKEAEDILYHIVRTPTNETLSIIRLIKNACLKLYNLAHIATNSPLKSHDSDDLLFKKLFSPSKLMTIIGDEIPLISEKQSLSKVLLNDENNELSDGTNFWDKNRQLTTDEIACYLQKIAANAKNT